MKNITSYLKSHPLHRVLLKTTIGLVIIFGVLYHPLFIKPSTSNTVITRSTSALPELAIGDWVFRLGTSRESQVIQALGGGEFSHIGMIVSLQPVPLIVHATTDDDPEHSNQVITSTLHDFISAPRAKDFSIARPRFVSEQQNQQAASWLLQQLSRPFILTARHNEHLYCTTLLVDALHHANVTLQPKWQQISSPLLGGEYLFPHAFATYPDIDWVYRSTL